MSVRHLAPLAAVAWLAAPATTLAGAWPQPAGQVQAIEQFTYYQTQTQGFDAEGRPAGRGSYRQIDVSPYVEYGLTDRLTLGMQPHLQTAWNTTGSGTKTSAALVEFDLFARWTLARHAGDVLALQGMTGVPGAASPPSSQLANRHAQYEARLLWGHGFRLGSMSGFTDLEAGYRARMGPDANEVRLDATVGVRPARSWLLLAQSFTTLGLRDNRPTGADYTITKLQVSAVYSVSRHVAVQGGFYSELAGRNVSPGNAGLVALWLTF